MSAHVYVDGEYGDSSHGNVLILDRHGDELAYWDVREWTEDPSLVLVIARAVRTALTEGDEAIKKLLGKEER